MQPEYIKSLFDLLLVWGHNNVNTEKGIPSHQICRGDSSTHIRDGMIRRLQIPGTRKDLRDNAI